MPGGLSALIIGHSFVRRMRDHVWHNDSLNLGLDQFSEVHWHGVGGMTLQSLWQESSLIVSLAPHVLVLDIGSNDLCSRSVSAGNLVSDLFLFVHHILAICPSIRQVVLFPVYYRAVGYTPRRNQRSLLLFNYQVFLFNGILRHSVRGNTCNGRLHLIRMRRIWSCPSRWLLPDGVHLNNRGLSHYRRFYLRALVTASSRF